MPKFITTSHGKVAILDIPGEGIPIVFLHGNSACKEIFLKQFKALEGKFRLIAIDFPGHGESQDAENPEETYSLPGYAETVIEVLQQLKIEKAVFLGWSLGGHVAIELVAERPDLVAGYMICSALPIELSEQGKEQAYLKFDEAPLLIKEEPLTAEEAEKLIAFIGFKVEEVPFLTKAAMRADGKARANIANSSSEGVGANQKKVVKHKEKIPLRIVYGSEDSSLRKFYIDYGINYRGHVTLHQMENCGHACFWQDSDKFNKILDSFASILQTSIAQKRQNFALSRIIRYFIRDNENPTESLMAK